MDQRGEAHAGVVAQARRLGEHHQGMDAGIDLRVVLCRLRHAEKAIDLREDTRQCAALAQHLEEYRRRRFTQGTRRFGPYALGHQRVNLAVVHHLAHQHQGLVGDGKALRRETRGEARHAQDAHRILREGGRDMAQQACLEIGLAAPGIDEPAVGITRHGIDGEVAAAQVVFQAHIRRGVEGKTGVAGAGLALGARQRVFLMTVGMQKDGEIGPHLPVAGGPHLLGRGAHHDPVPVLDRQTEQLVAYAATYLEDLHHAILPTAPGWCTSPYHHDGRGNGCGNHFYLQASIL